MSDNHDEAAAGGAVFEAEGLDELDELDESADESAEAFELDDDVGVGPSGPPALAYDGVSLEIPGLPTRADLVRLHDTAGLAATIAGHLRAGKPILFMPNDVNETNEYVKGAPVYTLHVFGVLANGAKAHVIFDNIEVFFDVRVPERPSPGDGRRPGDFGNYLRQLMVEKSVGLERSEDVEAFPIRGYRTAPVAWKRLHFPNLQERKKAIELVRGLGHETASDDLSSYFRMAARVYGVVLSDWGFLAGYSYYRGGAHAEGVSGGWDAPESPLCEHVFRVDIRNFKPLVDPMAAKDVQEKRSAMKAANPNLSRDRSIVLTWDIETYDSERTGDLPRATNPKTRLFMICVTVHWKDDPAPLHQVCLVDVPTHPDARWTTVVCGSEENVIRAFAVVYRHFAPEFITGFNDGDYDWPYVIERARQALALAFMMDTMTAQPRKRTTEEGVLRWNVQRDKRIKISAEETAFVTFLKVPGAIPIDVRVMFKQLFPKAEVGKHSSLNFYLKTCNLSAKVDLPIKVMWDNYESRDLERMRHVAVYCVVDARRCQELLVRRNVINDRREVASLSYVSLFDAIYYAGGHKVCNMLIAYAIRRNLLCSNINNSESETGKYPGAWVFHPKKGLVPNPKEGGIPQLEAARAEYVAAVAAAKALGDAPDGDVVPDVSDVPDGISDAPAALAAAIPIAAAQAEYLRLSRLAQRDAGVAARLNAAVAGVLAALKAYAPGRPVTGLDFAALYPSIIMAYNLSPEKFVESAAEAERLKREGLNLHYTEFMFNGRQIRGWFVRHDNDPARYGLYGTILKFLFDMRDLMKKLLAVEQGYKEHMELVMANIKKAGGSSKAAAAPDVLAAELAALGERAAALEADIVAGKAAGRKDLWKLENELRTVGRNADYLKAVVAKPPAEQYDALLARYRDACFNHTAIDSKQKALKVFMNTFYGEAGHSISPFFLLQLAGGVTAAGQYNIKNVADFVLKKSFELLYGDTDSLYVSAPGLVFREVDAAYAFALTEKEEYWTAMVEITMTELNKLRDEVNAFLRADNGSAHLRMAYEEVLFPVDFTGKKKYYGIGHVNVPNFHPKHLFIRGIDVVKQGQTELARQIGYRIMWQAVAVGNDKDIDEIVEAVLRDAIEKGDQWKFDDFVQSAAWKPNKNNVAVQKFIARMRVRVAEEARANERRVQRGLKPLKAIYTLPDPGERFQFILAKPGGAFNLRGLKANPKKGDIMEYAEVARVQKIPVDVAQYLKSYVVGLCARFINHGDSFLPPGPARRGMGEKQLDKHAQDAAKKYLEVFIAGLQNADPQMVQKRGYAYKRAWKRAAAECGERLFSQLGVTAEVFHSDHLIWSDFLPSEDEETVATLAAQAKELADSVCAATAADYVADYAKALGIAAGGADVNTAPGVAAGADNLYKAAQAFETIPRSRAKRPPGGRAPERPLTPLRSLILSHLDRREAAVRARLGELAPRVVDAATAYESCLAKAVASWRAREHAERPADLGEYRAEGDAARAPDDAAAANDAAAAASWDFAPDEGTVGHLREIHHLWFELVGIYVTRAHHQAIVAQLAALKDRRQHHAAAPSRESAREIIAASAKRLPPLGLTPLGYGGY